jgi:hypothetical protein
VTAAHASAPSLFPDGEKDPKGIPSQDIWRLKPELNPLQDIPCILNAKNALPLYRMLIRSHFDIVCLGVVGWHCYSCGPRDYLLNAFSSSTGQDPLYCV